MADLSLQPSINDVRGRAMLELIERLGSIDLTPLLVYRLDSAPDSALILLAWQFDVLAPQWLLATATTASSDESIDSLTDVDTLIDIDTLQSSADGAGPSDFDTWRTLLKQAISLHRVLGTPYAVSQALGALGWSSVAFLEGQTAWGGTGYSSEQGWAVFRVIIKLAGGQAVGPNDAARAIAAINFFKPARSWLDRLDFTLQPIADSAPVPTDFTGHIDVLRAPSDTVNAPATPLYETRVILPLYNARYYHTGITHGVSQLAVVDSGVVANGFVVAGN